MKRKNILVLILATVSLGIYAQPGNPGAAPIGGIFYLLLAGLGFGIIKLSKKRK